MPSQLFTKAKVIITLNKPHERSQDCICLQTFLLGRNFIFRAGWKILQAGRLELKTSTLK